MSETVTRANYEVRAKSLAQSLVGELDSNHDRLRRLQDLTKEQKYGFIRVEVGPQENPNSVAHGRYRLRFVPGERIIQILAKNQLCVTGIDVREGDREEKFLSLSRIVYQSEEDRRNGVNGIEHRIRLFKDGANWKIASKTTDADGVAQLVADTEVYFATAKTLWEAYTKTYSGQEGISGISVRES